MINMCTQKTTVETIASRLRETEDKIQDARNSGDQQAQSYAEGESLRLRRDLARLDPRGAGHVHLDLLSPAERMDALR